MTLFNYFKIPRQLTDTSVAIARWLSDIRRRIITLPVLPPCVCTGISHCALALWKWRTIYGIWRHRGDSAPASYMTLLNSRSRNVRLHTVPCSSMGFLQT